VLDGEGAGSPGPYCRSALLEADEACVGLKILEYAELERDKDGACPGSPGPSDGGRLLSATLAELKWKLLFPPMPPIKPGVLEAVSSSVTVFVIRIVVVLFAAFEDGD
jgi:hypothetical protein